MFKVHDMGFKMITCRDMGNFRLMHNAATWTRPGASTVHYLRLDGYLSSSWRAVQYSTRPRECWGSCMVKFCGCQRLLWYQSLRLGVGRPNTVRGTSRIQGYLGPD